jgi:hypothetical protein
MKKILSFVGLATLIFSSTATAVLIDFETASTSSGGGVDNGNPYIEDGYQITPGSSVLYAFEDGWQSDRGSSNGTTVGSVFSGANGASATFTVSRTDGADFNLLSIDLAELFNDGDFAEIGGSTVYNFTGFKTGPDVTTQLVLDGFSDGSGGAADFETFSFGAEWSGISGFFVSALYPSNNTFWNYAAFDNISVSLFNPSAVPVPAAVWLFGTALIGLVGFCSNRSP